MRAAYRLDGAYPALVWLLVFLNFNSLSRSAQAWDDVTWTASSGDLNWSNGGNWSSLDSPGATDRVIFTDEGAVSTVGVTTSVLDSDVEIGTLSIDNTVGLNHTFDLGEYQLGISDLLEENDGFYDDVATTTTFKNGSLELGASGRPANLSIATSQYSDHVTVDFSGVRFDATVASIIVGRAENDQFEFNVGTVIGGISGEITVGSVSQLGAIILGKASNYAFGNADVDFGGQERFSANVTELSVGVAEAGGAAHGRLVLPGDSTIQAGTVRVGYSPGKSSGATGTLLVGGLSTIATPNLDIGVSGFGEFEADGAITLGTSSEPVNFTVGTTADSWNGMSMGFVQVNGALNAHFSNITAGVKPADAFFPTHASIIAGTGGDVTVGSAASPGNVIVGQNAGQSSVWLPDLSSFHATVHNFWVGTSEQHDNVTTTVSLPVNTVIDADSIRIGYQTTGSQNSLNLNGHSELHADELLVGWDATSAELNAATNNRGIQHLQIGDPSRPTRMVVGHIAQSGQGNAKFSAALDGSLDATLSSLIVGEASGNARSFSSFQGAQYGEIRIGSIDARGTLAIGIATGNGEAEATLDLGQQDKLQAYLDRFDVGISDQRSSVSRVTLPDTVEIDALAIAVGRTNQSSLGARASLMLGKHNTIQTQSIQIGIGPISSIVEAPTSSDLLLGSSHGRVDLAIGSNNAPRGAFQTKNNSALDLSNTATTAFLNEVVIGDRTLVDQSTATGRLSFGPQAQVDAHRIILAQGNSVGILDFKGGQLTADEITKGTGNAQFNWNGGRLEVGQFGTQAIPFNLSNPQGTLAVPDSLGATHIYGNYTNGAVATFETSQYFGEFQQLLISGTAALNGTLAIQFEPGFQPALGETFTILSAAQVSGFFTGVTGFYTGDTFLNPVYNPSFVELQAYRAGDGNLDGFVDGADYTAWADHFLRTTNRGVAEGDYNGDGLVDGADYIVWADHFYVASGAGVAAMAVPEPSTRALAAIGLLLAAVFRGRRWIY